MQIPGQQRLLPLWCIPVTQSWITCLEALNPGTEWMSGISSKPTHKIEDLNSDFHGFILLKGYHWLSDSVQLQQGQRWSTGQRLVANDFQNCCLCYGARLATAPTFTSTMGIWVDSTDLNPQSGLLWLFLSTNSMNCSWFWPWDFLSSQLCISTLCPSKFHVVADFLRFEKVTRKALTWHQTPITLSPCETQVLGFSQMSQFLSNFMSYL